MKVIVEIRDGMHIGTYNCKMFGSLLKDRSLNEWGSTATSGTTAYGLELAIKNGSEFYLVEDTETKKVTAYMLADKTILRFWSVEEMTKLNSVDEIFAQCEKGERK